MQSLSNLFRFIFISDFSIAYLKSDDAETCLL